MEEREEDREEWAIILKEAMAKLLELYAKEEDFPGYSKLNENVV
jgi:hypothetical protein